MILNLAVRKVTDFPQYPSAPSFPGCPGCPGSDASAAKALSRQKKIAPPPLSPGRRGDREIRWVRRKRITSSNRPQQRAFPGTAAAGAEARAWNRWCSSGRRSEKRRRKREGRRKVGTCSDFLVFGCASCRKFGADCQAVRPVLKSFPPESGGSSVNYLAGATYFGAAGAGALSQQEAARKEPAAAAARRTILAIFMISYVWLVSEFV